MRQAELIRLRNHLGWNQRQFAEYLNVIKQAVRGEFEHRRRETIEASDYDQVRSIEKERNVTV